MTRTSLEKLTLSLIGITISTPVFAAGDSSGGLPQLDFSTWPTQIFWLIISFSLAFVLMQRVVTPRIASVLEERHTRLDDDMQMARQATDEAENLRMAFEKKLAEARTEASDRTRATVAEAQAEAEKKNTAAAKRITTRLDKAEARIREARDAAMKELGDVATQGAIDAAATLAGIKVTKTDAKKAVAAAAKAIPMAGEQN